MSSYATLLEEHFEEERFANDTFSNISSCLESLTEFVNEEVNFEMTISIQEAESGNIKDKDVKISKSLLKIKDKIIEKIEKFLSQIGEAVKRFISKAKITIAQCGNKALATMLKKNDVKIGKSVNMSVIKNGAVSVSVIYDKAKTAANKINMETSSMKDFADGSVEDVASEDAYKKEVDDAIEAMSPDFSKSDVVSKEVCNAGPIKNAYSRYVGGYLDEVKKGINAVEDITKKSTDTCKKILKELKKDSKTEYVSNNTISIVNKLSSDAMKISTCTLNFSMAVLTIATKNSAKLALAAVDGTGRAAAAGVKNAGKAVAEKMPKKAPKEEAPAEA